MDKSTSRGYRRWHHHIPSHQEHVPQCDLHMITSNTSQDVISVLDRMQQMSTIKSMRWGLTSHSSNCIKLPRSLTRLSQLPCTGPHKCTLHGPPLSGGCAVSTAHDMI